jgi:cleavage and polyadenylation specificity factor subunit 1
VLLTNSFSYALIFSLDGSERQIIKDMDGNMPRPKIRACSISDPFVLIIREDDSIGLFIGETERGKIRRKDMSAMGDKVRPYSIDDI